MKISVVIPTYNRKDMVIGAVECALNQIGQGDEYELVDVIVVDDCSTDSTENVILEKYENSNVVKYYKLSENRGPSVARNFGVKKAEGDWIALLDSDDIWYKNKLAEQAKYANNNPCYQMIYHTIRLTGIDGQTYNIPLDEEKRDYLEGSIHVPLLVQNFIGAPSMLIKKEVWEYLGGYNETMRYVEDWEFALRVSKEFQIGFVDKVLMDSQMIVGGLSSNDAGILAGKCYIVGLYRDEMLKYGILSDAIEKILNAAQERNILESIRNLLERCLQL